MNLIKRDLNINTMFNLLIDEAPDKLVIGGLIFDINTDFRTGIKLHLLLEDKNISWDDKIEIACKLYLNEQFEILEEYQYKEAFLQILDFYLIDDISEKTEESDSKKIFCYEHDNKEIWASFIQAYGIDLNSEKLHWFKFKTLLDNLPSDTTFSRILSYRTIDLNKEALSDEQKRVYKKLKQKYALPDDRSEFEKQQEFVNALW